MADGRQIPSAQVVMELVLHEAAANGDDKRIEELQVYLRRGKISVNQADVEWGNRTPLHCAAERGCYSYVIYHKRETIARKQYFLVCRKTGSKQVYNGFYNAISHHL